jgi:hypothetical protein
MRELQIDPKMRIIYSQMAGLTHFLASYDSGRYRDSLVGFLRAVYNGDQDPNRLARLIGESYPELDRQYYDFLKSTLPEKGSSKSDKPSD